MTENELRHACAEAGLGFEYERGVAASNSDCIRRLAEIVERETMERVTELAIAEGRRMGRDEALKERAEPAGKSESYQQTTQTTGEG